MRQFYHPIELHRVHRACQADHCLKVTIGKFSLEGATETRGATSLS